MRYLDQQWLDACHAAYLECLFWQATVGVPGELDEYGEPRLAQADSLDVDNADDFEECLYDDLDDFLKIPEVAHAIGSAGAEPAQVGHDFCLTRNGHGAGFWDRGYGMDGTILTEQCKAFGGVDVYINDDDRFDWS